MSNVSQRIQSLSPEKRELLARQLQKKGNRFNSFPLSFAQQRLWLLDQLEPGNASYDITTALRLRGDLKVEALEQSFNLIIQRHESLRTTFAVVQGHPVQVIATTASVLLPIIDLSGLDEDEREVEVQLQADKEAQYSFDLTKGLLVRIQLLRLRENEHVVLLNIHHIISDGWSTNVLIQELAVYYAAILTGRPSPLPDLPIQYADYAVWQRQWLQGEVLEHQLAYWRKHLVGAPALLELPTDRPRPVIQTYQGGTVSMTLPRLLAAHLRDLSQHEQVTLSMLLLTIFQLLLYRYTGQEDIVVGTHIANRNRADIEELIGFFVNTLVLRTDLSGDPSFRELLGRVREVALGAYAHQDLPFDRLVEELSPERSLSHTPLFQVCFNMVNLPAQRSEWPGLTADLFWPREAGAKFDLTLYAYELDESIRLELVYNAHLFDEARMLAMLRQFEYLTSQITHPEKKISSFSLVPPAERSILPDPTAPLSARWEGSVHHLFSQQARRLPEHVAVVDSVETISYQELDRRANQLAHYLITCGINPGDHVAIYSHRSATLVWAILGVLKAGAVYIILDPAYPAARLIDYLALVDIRGWLYLAAAGTPPLALEEYVATLSCCCTMELAQPVDGERKGLDGLDGSLSLPAHKVLPACPENDPGIEVGPDDLACITFTSGSTGRPKGVLQRHGPLSHFLPWQQERFGLTEADRYSMLSGLAHDPLQRDIFTALCLGGTVCIPAPDSIGTPGWLAEWMRQQQITIAHLTPAMLQLMTVLPEHVADGFALPSHAALSSLRYTFPVGDVLTKHDVSRLWKLAPFVTIVNFYGSTEAQRALSYYIVPRVESGIHEHGLLTSNGSMQEEHKEKESIPLGQGFQDVQLLVLNRAQKLAGVGELGEIYVRSPHLARGYVDDEGLTSARFIRNPFTDNVDDRMYRTGDLGRYRPDGNVEYAGRIDQQVKLRGFRIELVEIKAMLERHPAVQEAVVVLREDHPGEKRLVAYIVPSSISPIDGTDQELYSFLSTRLPGYMIPSAFVVLEALPLTPNGKVDRHSLPMPESISHAIEDTGAPRTPIEEILSGIWAKLLGRENIGIYENFFECGGHSLLATQLMARIYDVFQQEVRLQTLFATPTVAGLAAHLEQLRTLDTPFRRHALAPYVRVAGRSLLPASFAQERLWFLDQFEPGNTAYNLQAAFRVHGKVKVDVLQQSIHTLIRRHETLRTTFVMVEGRLMQAINADIDLPFLMVDLGGLPIEIQEAQVHYYAQRKLQRPFDLEHGPLFVFTLLRLSSTTHILLCTIHHSIFDAWSAEVLLRELDILYVALSEGRPASLPTLPLQYADFAVWQRERLQSDAMARQMAYWKQHLAGAPTVLDLPTDHPRPPVQTFRGTRASFVLSASLTHSLILLSRQKGVTLYMTLLAAFQVLLSRYSGQQDIAIGTPIAGRMASELEGLIGFFVNTLVLRGDLSGNPSFEELLGRVRAVALEAYAHQEVPFEKLVEALQPERSLSHSPLFQVLFVLQNAPTPALKLADLTLAPLEVPRMMAKFDLALMMWQEEACLQGNFEYNTDLFEDATIERMIGHLQTLLEGIVAHPHRHISRLPLLTAEERQRLLITWNATRADYPGESCIHHLFEAQVSCTPEAVALSFEGEQLTFEALNRRANQLARYVQRRANRRLTLVGLCVERSLHMVVGLLAILKAGAAYVPLDPDYPLERLNFMIHDAHIALLLTQKHLTARLSDDTVPVVYLDSEREGIAQQSDENLVSLVTPEHLAYVIYTSGSTGIPKGVQIAHRGVVNFLSALRREPGLGEQDVLLALTSLSFDIAGLEIFLPLVVGARVEIASREEATDGMQLMKRLETAGITVLQATPTTWRMLLEADWAGSACMKLLCGGEALPPALAMQLLKRGASLWNMYGPTETTIWSTLHSVTSVDGSIPIGRAIANTQIYLLDAQLELVPVGIPGELYIGGVGLSLGYLGRPGGTAERFVPDPFSLGAGARLYKTGDLARYRSDGTLEFLGRNDSQVKMRGFRIELQEIEAVLCQHPLIKEAVVVMRENEGIERAEGTEKQLVAYIVAREGSKEGEEGSLLTPGREKRIRNQELRRYLQDRLPLYMLPATFVWLATLPHTPNGKLDRRALPSPREGQYTGEHIHEALLTPQQDLLIQLWRQVLRREDVGLHDNFFALGGHSLLAAQLIARIRNLWQVELPLRSLFATPTVAGLAQHIETAQREESGLLIPPIVRVSRTDALPLSFAQQRLWLLNQWEHESSLYTMSFASSLSGQLDIAALERSLNTVVQRHEVLRSTFVLRDGQLVQVISPSHIVPLSVVDVRGLPSAERMAYAQQLCGEAFQRPFDLSQGPLLRLLLVRLTETEQVLLLTVHHIVFDDWSKDILLRELTVLYEAFASGRPALLPELPIQYADFAVWQRRWLQSDVLDRHLAYWKAHLAGAPVVLELPTDHPRPSVQSARGAYRAFTIPAVLTQQLQTLSQHEGVTLFMTLLAAFQVLLLRYSGQEDLVIGTPIANRVAAEVEYLIGCFINTLVVRTDLSGNPSFRTFLGRVREVLLQAYAHQDMPFEQLVEALQVERNLSHTPLFQVMFVWQQNAFASLLPVPQAGLREQEEVWHLPGLTHHPLDIEIGTAKFDLTLFLQQQADQLSGVMEYSTDLFEADTIERLTAHYAQLLQGIVAQPEQSLARLPLLSKVERQQLLVTWNDTQTHFSHASHLTEGFARQVARVPDALALACEDEQLTYQEVQARVSQLAHLLRSRGVEHEVLVAIFTERGVPFVVAMMAVFQAGGAFLPLDPQHPVARIRQVIEQSGVKLVLTTSTRDAVLQQALDGLTVERRPQVLSLESLLEDHSMQEPLSLEHYVSPRQLAYVIYTSGSTGLPKGAMIEQAGMLNHLHAKIAALQLTAEDVVAQTASQCSDISVWQILAALLVGGRVQILPDEVAHDPSRLLQEAQQRGVSILQTAPSLLNALLEAAADELGPPAVTSVRWLISTGEALPPELCRRWLQHYPHIPLLNGYGPTECSDNVTHHAIMQPLPALVSYTPIGRPLSNTRLYVLDRWGEIVPQGAFGELYVGGQSVGRGYLGEPACTAEVFVPDNMSGEAGARLYKTGDVVRYLSDGCLEYRGRIDQQVKLRGYRIELEEIQAMLSQHPFVREAVVLLREDEGTDKRLVAYIVANTEAAEENTAGMLSSRQLRLYLQQHLSAYMVPSAYVMLESLPRTANGKLDRRAFPPPGMGEAMEEGIAVSGAARTPVEEQLAQLWTQVLRSVRATLLGGWGIGERMEQIGIHENFFELGGHSLLATQLLGRVRDTFGVVLSLRSLFEAPTISAMARAIEKQSGQSDEYVDSIDRTEPGGEEALLGQLDQLSDEEVEALLNAVLTEEENEG